MRKDRPWLRDMVTKCVVVAMVVMVVVVAGQVLSRRCQLWFTCVRGAGVFHIVQVCGNGGASGVRGTRLICLLGIRRVPKRQRL